MKRGSFFLQKSTLCLIMILRKLDTVETIFIIYYTLKLKVCKGLKNIFSNQSRKHGQAVHLREE